MTLEKNLSPTPEADVKPIRPRLSFETITFSDGTKLQLAEDDIVVFVGPNNAGKSAALRELEAWIATSSPGLVVKNAALREVGNRADLLFPNALPPRGEYKTLTQRRILHSSNLHRRTRFTCC